MIRTICALWFSIAAFSVAVLLLETWPAEISEQGSAGLAAVSAGLSELVVETGLLAGVVLIVMWVWEKLADRYASKIPPAA